MFDSNWDEIIEFWINLHGEIANPDKDFLVFNANLIDESILLYIYNKPYNADEFQIDDCIRHCKWLNKNKLITLIQCMGERPYLDNPIPKSYPISKTVDEHAYNLWMVKDDFEQYSLLWIYLLCLNFKATQSNKDNTDFCCEIQQYLQSIIDKRKIFVYNFRFNPKQLQLPQGHLSLCPPPDLNGDWKTFLHYLYIDMLSIKANHQICIFYFRYLDDYYQKRDREFAKECNRLNL